MRVLVLALVALLGAYTLVGGVAGYVKAKSAASLAAGVAAGGLLLVAAALLARGSLLWGWLAVVVVAALLGRFLPAFLRTGQWWPGGYLVALAVPTLLVLLLWLLRGGRGQVPG